MIFRGRVCFCNQWLALVLSLILFLLGITFIISKIDQPTTRQYLTLNDPAEQRRERIPNEKVIEERFALRNQVMENFCKSYTLKNQLKPGELTTEHIYYPEANFYFCGLVLLQFSIFSFNFFLKLFSPPKTGTTTVDSFVMDKFYSDDSTYIAKLDNGSSWANVITTLHMKHVLLFNKFEEVNNLPTVKFIISREPLDRIWSCWHNKLSGLTDARFGKNQTDVQVS